MSEFVKYAHDRLQAEMKSDVQITDFCSSKSEYSLSLKNCEADFLSSYTRLLYRITERNYKITKDKFPTYEVKKAQINNWYGDPTMFANIVLIATKPHFMIVDTEEGEFVGEYIFVARYTQIFKNLTKRTKVDFYITEREPIEEWYEEANFKTIPLYKITEGSGLKTKATR